MNNAQKIFGLIGFPLSHSFSKNYFEEKFSKEKITNCTFKLYPIQNISELPDLIKSETILQGLSVTIPYKTKIIPFLDLLDETAVKTGAVNSIKIIREQKKILLIGYNTDIFGFEESLLKINISSVKSALILGTGGASLAVEWVLKKQNIKFKKVSRTPKKEELNYAQISKKVISENLLIINTTPLGMFPKTEECPYLPYDTLTSKHILFDLTYNPCETLFLRKGMQHGAQTKNGLEMLHLQAEKSWEIWNSTG